jgi:hypothetical protein
MPTERDLVEHDVVTLRVPAGNWPAGTKGAVVGFYDGAVLVEIAGADGRTYDLLTLSPARLAAGRS